MSKQLGLAVAAGLASAVLFAAVMAGNLALLTTYLAPLPLFAAGFGLGFVAVAVAAAVGLAAVALVAGSGAALPFAATAAVPAVVVVRQALLWRADADGKVEWYPPGLLLGWLTALAAAGLVLAALIAPEHADGLEGLVRDYVAQAAEQMAPGAPVEMRQMAVALWVPLLPAMLAAVWLLVAVLNAVLAQWALTRTGRNLRPTPAYQGLELPDWVAGALVVAAVTMLVAEGSLGYLARNAAALLLVPYVLLGLAVVHGAVRGRPNGGMVLALFYGVFVIVFGWAVLVVAGLGLVRHWKTLRRRFVRGRQEEE